MGPLLLASESEHLSPHDLVTYFRCPHEMAWHQRSRHHPEGGVGSAEPPAPARTSAHSPLLPPPLGSCRTIEGRLDLDGSETLAYEDPGERDLPVLFTSEAVRPEPIFYQRPNFIDDEWGFSGRPDLVVRRRDGSLFPIEYKATHLFVGYHEVHGRSFDVIQAIAECRLVHALTGTRPSFGIIWYGDAAGDGAREGRVEVPYGPAEEGWLRYALKTVRGDQERLPAPHPGTCRSCEANRAGACPVAAARFGAEPGTPASSREQSWRTLRPRVSF